VELKIIDDFENLQRNEEISWETEYEIAFCSCCCEKD
jgi:hypothetical protein